MITLIYGASHTGKTLLAQRLMERLRCPYLSIDHLKMGLIRAGLCPLTAESDDGALTAFLWPVVREIVKTNLENAQNLIVEGCYIPFDWRADFSAAALKNIRSVCLIFSERYFTLHAADLRRYENAVETRLRPGDFDLAALQAENARNLRACKARGLPYLLMDGAYALDCPKFAAGNFKRATQKGKTVIE